jgi:hypothetical protein
MEGPGKIEPKRQHIGGQLIFRVFTNPIGAIDAHLRSRRNTEVALTISGAIGSPDLGGTLPTTTRPLQMTGRIPSTNAAYRKKSRVPGCPFTFSRSGILWI